jgi:hypothetical protein
LAQTVKIIKVEIIELATALAETAEDPIVAEAAQATALAETAEDPIVAEAAQATDLLVVLDLQDLHSADPHQTSLLVVLSFRRLEIVVVAAQVRLVAAFVDVA